MRQRPDDGIQNLIEALANIFAQKPQHMISVFLEQNILAPITSVSLGISQVLTTIQFDCYLGFCAQQVHFHSAPAVERNGQFCIEPETTSSLWQCFQPAIKERLS